LAAPNFVCTICSQTFTRKWRGKVHNKNIHSGQGKTVRYIDYIIGRRFGEYLPSDPALYRHKPRSTSQITQPVSSDKKIEKELYFHSPNISPAPDERQHQSSYPSEDKRVADPIEQINEVMLKMAEIKKIVCKHLSPDEIGKLLSGACEGYLATGDIRSLDVTLDEVKKSIKLHEAKDLLNKP
jgi:hypothetical protein